MKNSSANSFGPGNSFFAQSMITKLSVDFSHKDERGLICQIFSKKNSQVNYLFSKRGSKRGGHYHKINKEFFFVISGRLCITGKDAKKEKKCETKNFRAGDFFVVEPYCVHELIFKEDTQMIAMYDRGVKNSGGGAIYICRKKTRFCFCMRSLPKKNFREGLL